MSNVWISAIGLCGASIIGSILGFFCKGLSHKWNDVLLGYCAGVMLAASIVGLILPAVDAASSAWTIVIAVMAGALLLNLLDIFTPHLHTITGLDPETHRNNFHLHRILLFVMAIALHKLPEGMAVGVSILPTSAADTTVSWSVTLGIALQNVPEGMVVIAPLLLAGISQGRTFLISLGIGLIEIVGVWIGYALGSVSVTLLPFMLGCAGGAMLYVTSDEIIPETHAHGYQKHATYALLLGFLTLVLLGNYWS